MALGGSPHRPYFLKPYAFQAGAPEIGVRLSGCRESA